MPGNYTDIYIGCDHDANYFAANVGGVYLNSGTCAFNLTDFNGNSLATGTCSYIATSNGNYQGLVPSSVTSTLTDQAFYYLIFTFSQAGANHDEEWINLKARYRGGGA